MTNPQRMKTRSHGLRAALLCASLAAVGCNQGVKTASGELIGVYAITGSLIDNSCGQTALPTTSPLSFEVEIRLEDSVGYWQMPKRPAQPGELEEDGSFRFRNEQTSLVSRMRAGRNLEPQDFNSLDPDFDLRTTTCTMKKSEIIEGTLARRFIDLLDGGTSDAKSKKMDLSGDNRIEVEPTEDSDCSAALAALGGTFNNLPCSAHYKLKGELIESRAEP